jgi:hypothetical protein
MMTTKDYLLAMAMCMTVGWVHGLECTEWKDKLQADIQLANQCEPKYQACLAKEFGNPMRELDYCKKVLKRCESLEARPGNGPLPKEVEAYKKQCEP